MPPRSIPLACLAVGLACLLPACASTSHGALKGRLAEAHGLLDRGDPIAAERVFRRAEAMLVDDPTEDGAEAVADGLARVDIALIDDAVTSAARIAGHDGETIAELDRLHRRLRAIGGNPTAEASITQAINVRASLMMTPHERAATLTDLGEVLDLGRYPQLDDATRQRLSALSAKAWRVYQARAADSAHELVRRTFAGLAAGYSGAALADGVGQRDRDLAAYARGSKLDVTAGAAACPSISVALRGLARPGSLEVDATVAIDGCATTDRQESNQVTERYLREIPYQTEETYFEQVCYPTRVAVSYCVNPYTHDGCVGSSETVAGWECSSVQRTGMVTRYRQEPATRVVTRTTRYATTTVELRWTTTFQGATAPGTRTIAATQVDGVGPRIEDEVAAVLRAALDAPVAAAIDRRAAELRAAGDAALARGARDDAELAYLRAVFLGRSAGDYFQREYAASDDRLREVLEARPARPPADRAAAVEPLPAVSDLRRDRALVFVRDRFAATFPPAMSRVKGLWYGANLGAISVRPSTVAGAEVGGGTAAAFGIQLGTPVLARIHGRTRGVAPWDDAAVGGLLGYTASTTASGDRAPAFHATARYTAGLGLRLPGLQLVVGARASASALKVGATTGHATALSYYGNLGLQLGKPSLTLEAWAPTPRGDRSRGAQLFLGVRTPSKQYNPELGAAATTSYLALRVDDERYDACAAAAGACVDVADQRVLSIMLAFGAGFR